MLLSLVVAALLHDAHASCDFGFPQLVRGPSGRVESIQIRDWCEATQERQWYEFAAEAGAVGTPVQGPPGRLRRGIAGARLAGDSTARVFRSATSAPRVEVRTTGQEDAPPSWTWRAPEPWGIELGWVGDRTGDGVAELLVVSWRSGVPARTRLLDGATGEVRFERVEDAPWHFGPRLLPVPPGAGLGRVLGLLSAEDESFQWLTEGGESRPLFPDPGVLEALVRESEERLDLGLGCASVLLPDLDEDGVPDVALGADYHGWGAVLVVSSEGGEILDTLRAPPRPQAGERRSVHEYPCHFGVQLETADLDEDGVVELLIAEGADYSDCGSDRLHVFSLRERRFLEPFCRP